MSKNKDTSPNSCLLVFSFPDDMNYREPCCTCGRSTRWFNMILQDAQCNPCFSEWHKEYKEMKERFSKNNEQKLLPAPQKKDNKVIEVRILHANRIYIEKRNVSTWYLKGLWNQYWNKWDAYSRETTNINYQGLIQCRHYLVALTRILKDRGSWCDFTGRPLENADDKAANKAG